jgi:hypothetical protein
MKASDLTGLALNWAVAKREGWPMDIWYDEDQMPMIRDDEVPEWKPSTDWSQAGPIIEREEIGIKRNAPCSEGRQWEASGSITAKGAGYQFAYGPTPLIAAMRCFVASRLGDEIDLPEGLV